MHKASPSSVISIVGNKIDLRDNAFKKDNLVETSEAMR